MYEMQDLFPLFLGTEIEVEKGREKAASIAEATF